jgi:Zn-dependent peptidase ImmA (M78 family)
MGFLDDAKKETITNFVKFVKKELGIERMPTIILQNGKGNIKTTALYNYQDEQKLIRINAKNRAVVDVLRSIAHELTHHRQWEQGRLKVKPPDIGYPIENEANAKAGIFIKMFGKLNPEIYND